jgi:hypothetical protein
MEELLSLQRDYHNHLICIVHKLNHTTLTLEQGIAYRRQYQLITEQWIKVIDGIKEELVKMMTRVNQQIQTMSA